MPNPRTEPNLPPPGDERREVLAERTDTLAQEAETRAAVEERFAIDPKAFRIENEIAAHLDTLKVSGALPEFAYRWVNFISIGGIMVTRAQNDGWEVVRAEMPEAIERRDELGRRRLGDVILMRIPIDRKLFLDRRDIALARLQAESSEAALLEMGEKYAGHGITVKTELDPAAIRRAEAQAAAREVAGAGKNIAGRHITDMVRGRRV